MCKNIQPDSSIVSAISGRPTKGPLRASQRDFQLRSFPLPCNHANSAAFMRALTVELFDLISFSSDTLTPSAIPRSSHMSTMPRTDVRTSGRSFSPTIEYKCHKGWDIFSLSVGPIMIPFSQEHRQL